MHNISILGVTGSIGTQTLDVIRKDHNINLVGISAKSSVDKVWDIIKEFKPKYVAMMDESCAEKLKSMCQEHKYTIYIYSGMEGLIKIATLKEVDMVVTSVVGMIGLRPTMEAIKSKKNIALANKETLVVGGKFVIEEARKNGVSILPVDSEHGAIFQCLQGNEKKQLKKLLLTASGGPFRGKSFKDIERSTLKEALSHPKWNMGKKISVDSATLMNKGLEVIEAHYLFDVDYENIQVVVHPESVIHSMVEYKDNSVMAQMAVPDMRLPIQYALNYPNRESGVVEQLDFYKIAKLTFEKPDLNTFKCLRLAYEAGKKGGNLPVILNAANEIAVNSFIEGKITFGCIGDIIENALSHFKYQENIKLDDVYTIDNCVRRYVSEIINLRRDS